MQKSYLFAETSPAAPSTGTASSQPVSIVGSGQNCPTAGVAFGNLDACQSLLVVAALVGATGGTLDVVLQTSPDFGTTWVDWAHFAQLASGAGAIKYAFAASKSGQLLVPAVVGIGLVPSLAAATVIGGGWGDRFRLSMVAGGSTTAGAPVSVWLVGSSPALFQ